MYKHASMPYSALLTQSIDRGVGELMRTIIFLKVPASLYSLANERSCFSS